MTTDLSYARSAIPPGHLPIADAAALAQDSVTKDKNDLLLLLLRLFLLLLLHLSLSPPPLQMVIT